MRVMRLLSIRDFEKSIILSMSSNKTCLGVNKL